MMTRLQRFAALLIVLGVVLLPGSRAFAQTALSNTTLSAAITSTSQTTISVASASGMIVNTRGLYIDHEYMTITGISGTQIRVTRGAFGTNANLHATSSVVIVTRPEATVSVDPIGPCTNGTGLAAFAPVVNTVNGNIWLCRSSLWAATNVQKITNNSLTLTP